MPEQPCIIKLIVDNAISIIHYSVKIQEGRSMPTKKAEEFLTALADELAISESRYEQACRSYTSLGEWLHRPESAVIQYDPQVYVQGSFRLGTAIRPLNDEEEYDVDSVCLLQSLSTQDITQNDLKTLLGDEIKAYRKAQNMVRPVREGRRCWVLDYADGAQFHMDVVPSLPNAARQRMLLETYGFDLKWSETAMVITDIESPVYHALSDDWQRSNPKGYAEWFKLRMRDVFERRRKVLAESMKASVEDIPDYKVRTPLQSAIMILKRHRDGMFEKRYDERPISIVITTLAAHAYNGEDKIADALYSILAQMDSFIEHDGHRYIIRNPSDPLENFADKWPQHPEREAAFFEWLQQARQDFGDLAKQMEKRNLVESVRPHMGAVADRAATRLGPPPESMLQPASTIAALGATAVSTPAFPNTRREPTSPKGFA
ncbi:nucleotidyltransferase [Serratia nevei]|uniref:nucleotidyltransferase domain-containing protein n=1 Tax=Serratia nevei TaxID=2703794 RepID=UPI0020A11849|nr:nucleotidyltransferase [Serratia nevei]MCP1105965.1 nucleotidyltransferase [Serratia nevei]